MTTPSEPAGTQDGGAQAPRAEDSAGTAPAGAPPSADELARLREERGFYLDQLQRSRAEFDNYRKRTTTDRDIQVRRMKSELLRQVVDVYDHLRKAEENLRGEQDIATFKEGIRLITGSFVRLLEQHRVLPIEALGRAFDPAWHEAVFHEESTNSPPGMVLQEFERGYRLEDGLLRPARVIVARAPGVPGAPAGEQRASGPTTD